MMDNGVDQNPVMIKTFNFVKKVNSLCFVKFAIILTTSQIFNIYNMECY